MDLPRSDFHNIQSSTIITYASEIEVHKQVIKIHERNKHRRFVLILYESQTWQ